MPLKPPAEAQLATQAELLAKVEEATPEVINADAVLALSASDRFVFRSRVYEALPTGFKQGLIAQRALSENARTLKALEKGELSPLEAAMRMQELTAEGLDACARAVRPVGILPRLWWLIRGKPNPFRGAQGQEAGRILGFICAALTSLLANDSR